VIIVLDTCVLVSAFISPHGVCSRILDGVFSGNFIPAVSPVLLAEYRTVVARKKFERSFRLSAALRIIDAIEVFALHVDPYVTILPPLPDPNDHGVAEVAVEAQADALITSNVKDFYGFTHVPVRHPFEFARACRLS
jgi:putative PIN family toxin of toxin-antitoxin system